MSKVARYLQEHLVGEVMTSADAREHFSTDASIFKILPQIVVYPRSENDVRKAARFSWQLAERGRVIPITARGLGTDQGGAAIGGGIILAFPAHMNKILSLNTKKLRATIQPGLNYGKLQQALHTHGLFLPPYPASFEYSTLGGAISNNAAGEKTIKYGSTREFVKKLRVVLANGEVMETRRLSKRELNSKMGLPTFEGEIYRSMDALITESKELIASSYVDVTKNNAGYNLASIKNKDGSFDLTPLLVGAQGTLGIITEAEIELENYNPKTQLYVAGFDSIASAVEAINLLRKLTPSALEMVDKKLLEFVDQYNPNLLGKAITKPFDKLVLLVEFDDSGRRSSRKKAKKAKKILQKFATAFSKAKDEHEQEDFWKIRQATAVVSWQAVGTKKALPVADDAIVPPEMLGEFLDKVHPFFAQFNLEVSVWGHAGDANFHMQPFMDLSQIGDRQKLFKIADAFAQFVIEMGGSTNGELNDGRLRATQLAMLYGQDVYDLFVKVKQVFDPYGTLNAGVKVGVSRQALPELLRHDFSLENLYNHMPRT